MRIRLLEKTFLVLGALCAAGCSEDFVATGSGGGTTSPSTSGGAGGAGGQTTTTSTAACAVIQEDACNECLVQACPGGYCTCAGKPDCVDMAACGRQAKNATDLALCWIAHKESVALAGQIQVCGNKHCPVCNFPAVDMCTACEYSKCPDAVNACLGDQKCLELASCIGMCKGAANPAECQNNCTGMYPEGMQPLQGLVDCATSICSASCGGA